MRDETKMDVSRLITEIHKRPALWNQRHVSYHNRDFTNRTWTEMTTIFKLPKQFLKTKWKGLRDTFRAEIKKEKIYRKSNCPPSRPVWVHFENLQFLKEQMLPRPPVWERNVSDAPIASTEAANCSNKTSTDTTTVTRDNNRRVSKRLCSQQQQQQNKSDISRHRDSSKVVPPNNDEQGVVEITVQSSSKDENTNVTLLKKNRNKNSVNRINHQQRSMHRNNRNNKSDKDSNNEKQPKTVKQEPVDNNLEEHVNCTHGVSNNEISSQDVTMTDETSATPEINSLNGIPVSQLIDLPENNRFDDNYFFFMSLLPHIRTLPADRRMFLRMQMQQLVYQEVYNKNNRSNCSTTT